MAKLIEQLTFPYTTKEPELSPEELIALDSIADQVELQRLEKLGVQSPDKVPSSSKVLSTRFCEDLEREAQQTRASSLASTIKVCGKGIQLA